MCLIDNTSRWGGCRGRDGRSGSGEPALAKSSSRKTSSICSLRARFPCLSPTLGCKCLAKLSFCYWPSSPFSNLPFLDWTKNNPRQCSKTIPSLVRYFTHSQNDYTPKTRLILNKIQLPSKSERLHFLTILEGKLQVKINSLSQ
jgi:hypothetical protein